MQNLSELLLLLVAVISSIFGIDGSSTEDAPKTETEIATVVRVIDGDTIVVNLSGTEERVRYVGIDTPELARNGKQAECMGEEAKGQNEFLVLGQEVTLKRDISDKDKYGRLLRYVYVEDVLVQEQLVEGGFAEVFYYKPDITKYKELKDLEKKAKENQEGMWGSCQ